MSQKITFETAWGETKEMSCRGDDSIEGYCYPRLVEKWGDLPRLDELMFFCEGRMIPPSTAIQYLQSRDKIPRIFIYPTYETHEATSPRNASGNDRENEFFRIGREQGIGEQELYNLLHTVADGDVEMAITLLS